MPLPLLPRPMHARGPCVPGCWSTWQRAVADPCATWPGIDVGRAAPRQHPRKAAPLPRQRRAQERDGHSPRPRSTDEGATARQEGVSHPNARPTVPTGVCAFDATRRQRGKPWRAPFQDRDVRLSRLVAERARHERVRLRAAVSVARTSLPRNVAVREQGRGQGQRRAVDAQSKISERRRAYVGMVVCIVGGVFGNAPASARK